jgi:hemoglobin
MSIYDNIGGAPAIRAAVDDFYTRVLADARLAPFFTGTDLPPSVGRRFSRAVTWPPRMPGSASRTVISTPSWGTSPAR